MMISFALKIAWNQAKSWIIITSLIRLISGILPIFTVIITEKLIREIVQFINLPSKDITPILYLLLIQLLLMIIKPTCNNIFNLVNIRAEKEIDHYLENKISEKTSSSPIFYFDNPSFNDHLERLKFKKGQRLLSPLSSLFMVIQHAITLISLMIYLCSVHWILALLSILVTVPYLVYEKKFGLSTFVLYKNQSPETRMTNYLSLLMSNKQSAMELKLFNSREYILNKWSKVFKKLAKQEISLGQKRELMYIGISSLSATVYFISSLLVVWILKTGKSVSVGSFVAVMQAFQESQTNLQGLSKNISQIYNESLYISDLYNFLNFEDDKYNYSSKRTEDFPPLINKGIEIENLNFTYPFNNNQILKNINLTIKPNEKIAIVGSNGSGKTTLIKCLLGLYPTKDNEIKIEGLSLNRIKLDSIFQEVTTIFQDFMKYNLTVKENIAFSENLDNVNNERLTKIIEDNNLNKFIGQLPKGFNTILGRMFNNGEELSGGQWQKIALSRALFKGGQLFILDEPTSALDPKAEIEIFEKFNDLVNNQTAIFISHRMASAKMADKIVVMKKGEIVEIGNHEELILKNGEYAEMYNAQAKWYKETNLLEVGN
ncbi:ABC transporter ATP-binding protein [Virgibacillus sp. 6R]|uniref:ABC transporter ATP-binding protein n=1 Tax=Metabacillus sp. 22489 TaxID=3453928 RepID=UPI0011A49F38